MGWGIDATIWIARWVSSLPGAVQPAPPLPMAGVVLIVFGGLWLCLWQQRWRYWGLAGIVAGFATMLIARPPDIVLADFGKLLAVRSADGFYYVAPGAEKLSQSFLASQTGARLLPWPAAASDTAGRLDCPTDGRCFYSANGRRVALVRTESGLPVACEEVDAIVAQVPAGFACRGKIPVADRIDNWRHGAIALWLSRDGVASQSANASRGDRPWVPRPMSAKERAAAIAGEAAKTRGQADAPD
jgi:competence protein ComEC